MSTLKAQKATIAKKNKMLTTEEAAKFLGYGIHALKKWRSHGKGPAFYKGKGGMVFYDRADLEKFKPSVQLRRVVPTAKAS